MATDAPIVESSPTEKSSTQILKELTPKQHQHWRVTGELPEAKETPKEAPKDSQEPKQSTEAASSPAAKETPESAPKGAAETPAEPVPAKSEPSAKPKTAAEARIKDLLAENKKLNEELETLRKNQSAPAKKTEALAKPGRNDADDKGQPKYKSDEEYLEARDKWVMDEAKRQTREEISKETQTREVAKQNELIQRRMLNSIKVAVERHPDFLEVLKAETKDGKTVFNSDAVKAIKTNGVLDAWILDSEIGMELLYHFAKNGAEEVERIQSLGPFAAARELTKLEEKLSAAPVSGKEKPAENSPTPKSKEPPAPATRVDGKNTPAVDEENAAAEAGDFKRYKKAANEADWRKKGAK